MGENQRLRVLLVEDEESDILFLTRAFRTSCAVIDLEIARDGDEAVRLLSRNDGRPLPDRIILDLKLPRKSGTEVLAWIRSNPDLKHLSVTVLTSSAESMDFARIKQLGVDDYLVKPVSYQELLEIVSRLGVKWGIVPPK
jgi:CheY-like chemotaxis protein